MTSAPRHPERHNSLHATALSIVVAILLSACQSTPTPDHLPVMVIAPASDSASVATDNRSQSTEPVHSNNTRLKWRAELQTSFAKARSLVELELSVDLANIELRLVNDASINREVELETRRLISAQFGKSAFAKRFLDQVMQPLAGTYAALYSSRLKAVMISDSMLDNYERSLASQNDQATAHSALLTLLIHELVHAADDERYAIHDNRALNFRASFAQSATFEGHAQWVTRQICKKAGCSEGLSALDHFMFSTNAHSEQLTQPIEAISRNVLEYSYIEGEQFIAGLSERENGAALIDKLLSQPPLDPIQILAPASYPDVQREQRNQRLLAASRNMYHPWASSPWIGIETSPLKGIDLRSDPLRRQAAIDGFTRLIVGMVSVQFYDQNEQLAPPVEATVLQAESDTTARLFAGILHRNTQQPGARFDDEPMSISTPAQDNSASMDMHIYRTAIDTDKQFRTAIAVSGVHVVQVSGNLPEQTLLDDYAIRVLLNLRATQAAGTQASTESSTEAGT